MTVNLHIMPNSLIAITNTTHIIASTDPRYALILQVLSKGFDEQKIIDILLFQDEVKDIRIEVKPEENKILVDNVEMPETLQKRFMDLKRRHKPRSYILNFWDKLQKNPNKKSVQMLYKFLENNGHPIMADGNFIAYKAVRQDLKDHHSGTNEHKVGKIIRMDRDAVNADPGETCSTGLHIASWGYLKNFHAESSRYFEVIVDPKDVVAVPNDYNGTKCRVCAYKVYREVKSARKEELTTQANALKALKALKKELKKGKEAKVVLRKTNTVKT